MYPFSRSYLVGLAHRVCHTTHRLEAWLCSASVGAVVSEVFTLKTVEEGQHTEIGLEKG